MIIHLVICLKLASISGHAAVTHGQQGQNNTYLQATLFFFTPGATLPVPTSNLEAASISHEIIFFPTHTMVLILTSMDSFSASAPAYYHCFAYHWLERNTMHIKNACIVICEEASCWRNNVAKFHCHNKPHAISCD